MDCIFIVFKQVAPNFKPKEGENKLEEDAEAVEDTPLKKSETKKKV